MDYLLATVCTLLLFAFFLIIFMIFDRHQIIKCLQQSQEELGKYKDKYLFVATGQPYVNFATFDGGKNWYKIRFYPDPNDEIHILSNIPVDRTLIEERKVINVPSQNRGGPF